MKEAGGISFGDSVKDFARKCKGKQGRARLAAAVGVLAMLLILLSELFPQNTAAGSTKNTKSAQSSTGISGTAGEPAGTSVSQRAVRAKTTVMVTLETGKKPFMRWIHSPEKCSPSRPMSCWKMVQP